VPALFEKIGWQPRKQDAGASDKKSAPGSK